MPAQSAPDPRVEAVRRFNRFYTRHIGLLHKRYLNSPFSLAEVRVLYELAHRDAPTAIELARELGLDAGYLSRILLGFEKRGFIARTRSAKDARRRHLSLTRSGRAVFAPLETGARQEVAAMLDALSPASQHRLVQSMTAIETLLGASPQSVAPYTLRTHQPGDMGWVIHRHGALYAREYGWDEQFEALVAEIAARFIRRFDARRERCWIAEKDGAIVGSVFLVKHTAKIAKLRLLLVEPEARGLGIGKRLVDECIRFARQAGYKSIRLWTQDVLHAARNIYAAAGFQLVHKERHHSFGHDMTAETWELRL